MTRGPTTQIAQFCLKKISAIADIPLPPQILWSDIVLKLMTVDELRPGMFIHKLDVWWIKDTRIRNQMLITDPQQIALLRNEGIHQLWVDINKSVQAPLKPQEKSHC